VERSEVEAIRTTANAHISKVMDALGVQYADRGTRLTGKCPVPHSYTDSPNNNPTAFSWSYDYGGWCCFTHHCEHIFGCDIFGLVRSLREISFIDSVKLVKSILDVKNFIIINNGEQLRTPRKPFKHSPIELYLMRHLSPINYYKQRGLSFKTVREFNAGGAWFCHGTYGHGRLIVPVHDPISGFPIGFTCRSLKDEFQPKWLHCKDFSASQDAKDNSIHINSCLFNLHRVSGETIIITEGPFDVMKLHEAGIKNAVALLGSGGISEEREILLKEKGIRNIVLLLDHDEAGLDATMRIWNKHKHKFKIKSLTKLLPLGSDPGGASDEVIKNIEKEYELGNF
jgi:hypothetical protein